MKLSIAVTGVSTGIGRAIAEDLLAHGFRVFGSVRREADAERLTRDLGPDFTPLLFDVTDSDAIHAEAARVAAILDGEPLFGLVNNAGMTSGGPLMHQPPEEILRTLHVNGLSAVIVSQAFLPLLGARRGFSGRPGRIVNISSVGGRLVAPFAAAYQAGKHALEAFSDGMRRELMLYGIDVIVIQPGAVATPIWEKTQALDLSSYAATDYAESLASFMRYASDLGKRGYPAARIAQTVRLALTARKPRARYAVVQGRAFNWSLPRMLPDRWMDRLVAGRFNLTRRA